MICDICKRKNTSSCPIDCLTNPKINIGSGGMLKQEYINFDLLVWKYHYLETDIIGDIKKITEILPLDYFQEIICFHTIEHFRKHESINVLEDFYKLLIRGGRLILEAPDILGSYDYFVTRKKSPSAYIDMIFSTEAVMKKHGKGFLHRSGWTRDIAAETMQKIGFKITQKGIGLSHGMGPRDFRVEGIK